jgi:hypothetical protein
MVFWALLQKCMGSGASIHVEPYLDNETASLSSDESIESIDSMDTVNMSDESDSDNESFLSIFFTIYPGCFARFYNVFWALLQKCFINVYEYIAGKEVSEKS